MRTRLLASVFSTIVLCSLATAQVTVKRGAVVYHGSAANTTAPATIKEKLVRAATPEWKKIQDNGIDPTSAHGKQLITKMNKRIREAVKAVADREGRDMVTRKKDLKDDRGREVVDLTDLVIAEIEN